MFSVTSEIRIVLWSLADFSTNNNTQTHWKSQFIYRQTILTLILLIFFFIEAIIQFFAQFHQLSEQRS